nr:MAG TPA: hypothetical protein [Caudoviricetes sp.]
MVMVSGKVLIMKATKCHLLIKRENGIMEGNRTGNGDRF